MENEVKTVSAPLPVEWKGDVETVRKSDDTCPTDAINADDGFLVTEAFIDAARRLAAALESTHRRAEGLEAERDRLREALRPFTNFACETPHPAGEPPCHNCIARDALNPTVEAP